MNGWNHLPLASACSTMRWTCSALLPLALAGCATVQPTTVTPPRSMVSTESTRVLDRDALGRLLANRGVTLQWISWDQRGSANARWDGDRLLLTAAQAKSGAGRLYLDGQVTEIGSDYFAFRGLIRIEDAPDPGRRCEASKEWRFAVTQNRSYWRLREFEWCDGLTDYIDIYF
jgi:hypothetical protein